MCAFLIKLCFKIKVQEENIIKWNFGDGNSMEKTDTSRIVYQYSKTGVYKVWLKAIDIGTCVGVDSTSTTIYVNKATGFAGENQIMCFDAGTTLIAGGGVKYNWSTTNGLVSDQATPRG